jgi:heptosyltransferase-2
LCAGLRESSIIELITNTLKAQGIETIAADDLTLQQSFALLSRSNLFVGNDSSLLNASACVGVQSIGLFGATPVLHYSPFMHAIVPSTPGLTGKEGMLAISPPQVLAYLQERQLLQGHI